MMTELCDICGEKEAEFTAIAFIDGIRRIFKLCERDCEVIRSYQSNSAELSRFLRSAGLLRRFIEESESLHDEEDSWEQVPLPAFEVRKFVSHALAKVLKDADRIAIAYSEREITDECVVRALLADETTLGVLSTLGVDVKKLESLLEQSASKLFLHEVYPYSAESILLSSKVYDALEKAFIFAKELGYESITPLHLLIGLITEGTGNALNILRQVGVNPYDLKQDLIDVSRRIRTLHAPY